MTTPIVARGYVTRWRRASAWLGVVRGFLLARVRTPTRRVDLKCVVLAVATSAIVALCHFLPGALASEGRWTLAALFIAVLFWSSSNIPDVVIGVFATIALVLCGAVTEASVLRSLGHEFIWLMIVSFAVGAVIRANRLVEWFFVRSGMAGLALPGLVAALTFFISATAFLIPSTSARAAILLPIFVVLAQHATAAQRTALGLLFPTVILLSAGASLIGAGAHVVAAQVLEQQTGRKIDLLSWAALALPFSALTTIAAATTIFLAFVPRTERRAVLRVELSEAALDQQQRRSLMVISAMICGWATAPWHGLGMVTIGLLALAVLLLPGIGGGVDTKTAFKAVQIELLIFLATTFVLADAIIKTGAGQAIASSMMAFMSREIMGNSLAVATMLAALGLVAHLLIASRTARVSVLLPTFVLPLVGLGHDATTLVMICVLATGFCQTLPASAKPVGVFAGVSPQAFTRRDLIVLSLLLLPQMFVALVVYAAISIR